MTPAERTRLSLYLLRCLEMTSRAREDGDIPALLRWQADADRVRARLLADPPPELLPEPGPQGEAAL